MKPTTVCFSIGDVESSPKPPHKVKRKKEKTLLTNCVYDPIFGYGLPEEFSFTITGKAGTGKTTFLLNYMQALKDSNRSTKHLFITNEMSESKLAAMCERIGVKDIDIVCMTNIDSIVNTFTNYTFVVIDSLQGVRVPGLEGKSKEPEAALNRIVEKIRETKCTVGIISHLTKDGKVKGNSSIGHIVDCNISLHKASAQYIAKEDWKKGIIVYVEKNRSGDTGYLPLEMTPSGINKYCSFVESCFELLQEIPKYAIVKG